MGWNHFFIEGYYCGKCKNCKAGRYVMCERFVYVDDPWCFGISRRLHRFLVRLDSFVADLIYCNRVSLWFLERRIKREDKNDSQ